MKMLLCTILLVVAVAVSALPKPSKIDQAEIQFKISGRDLPNKGIFGTVDAFVKVFLSENNGKRVQVGRQTDTVSNNQVPKWTTIIEFGFDRTKNQHLHFEVWDEDNWNPDDKIAIGTINVADFVDKGQDMDVPLNPDGSLHVQGLQGLDVKG